MDQSLLISICLMIIIFSGIGGVIFILWRNENEATKKRKNILSMANNQNNNINKVNNQNQQKRHNIRASEENLNEENADESANENNEDEKFIFKNKKVGKKKLAKLQAKAEAKTQREYEQAQRAEQKKEEEEREQIELERRKIEENEEKMRLEKLKIEKENKKLLEQKEYEKLKCSFNVEEQGFDQLEENELINTKELMIEYIKKVKVIYLDEFASKFQLNIDNVILKIKQLIDEKHLNGVFDEQGKFIYITDEELLKVVKFINQRGRVSVNELTQFCNRSILMNSIKTF